ncbi:MAG TPA: endonuclease/exonuclease/phosphatase family protein [Woeseiaceae bacterium]
MSVNSYHWKRRIMGTGGLLLAAMLAGCGLHQANVLPYATDRTDTPAHRVTADPTHCEQLLAGSVEESDSELDRNNIRLLSWNTQKAGRSRWQTDFTTISQDRNLVLLQEAVPTRLELGHYSPMPFVSFAPGFSSPYGQSGVATLSSVRPLTQCHLEYREPWLRTTKATNVTEYGLTGSGETLAVINIHAINFSLGTDTFSRQLGQIAELLAVHKGPVIVSGDFNTWNQGRLDEVQQLALTSGLQSLRIPNDQRSLFFGKHVDHVFMRGLQTVAARTPTVHSSDHNPITAVLRVL